MLRAECRKEGIEVFIKRGLALPNGLRIDSDCQGADRLPSSGAL